MPRPLYGSNKQCNARDALLRLSRGLAKEGREGEGKIANKLACNTFAESTIHNRIAVKFDGKASVRLKYPKWKSGRERERVPEGDGECEEQRESQVATW